jgi:hypothetical protein
MMKKLLLASAALLAVSACSQNPTEEADRAAPAATQAVEASADAASMEGSPPDIGQAVAPGVAFDFSYDFSLPENRIAEAQEAHAALCGKLGLSRCRVTGLTFNKEPGGTINASTSFKLDPAMALTFGRDATAIVERAEGKLESSAAKGEDVGSQIVAGDQSADALKADIRRIEAQLAIPKLSRDARAELLGELREAKSRLAALKSTRSDQVESLANTPMVFTYQPSASALTTGLSAGTISLSALAITMAYLFGLFGPFLILAGLAFWGWRRFRGRKVTVVK